MLRYWTPATARSSRWSPAILFSLSAPPLTALSSGPKGSRERSFQNSQDRLCRRSSAAQVWHCHVYVRLDCRGGQRASPKPMPRRVSEPHTGRLRGPRADFDHQHIEAQATVSACLEAYRATSDLWWYE